MEGQPYQCSTCRYWVQPKNGNSPRVCSSPVFMKTVYWDKDTLQCSAWEKGDLETVEYGDAERSGNIAL